MPKRCRINNDVRDNEKFNGSILCSVEGIRNTVLINLNERQAAILLSNPAFQKFATFEAELDLEGCEPSVNGYLIPKHVKFTSPLSEPVDPAQVLEDMDVLTGGDDTILPEAAAAASAATARKVEFINQRRRDSEQHADEDHDGSVM